MSDCIFCKVIAGELPSTKVYEDDKVIVINDIYPQAAVHMLVIPKEHVIDITEAHEELVSHIVQVARKIIIEKKIAQHRIVANGKGAQLVKHLHMHILGGVTTERKL